MLRLRCEAVPRLLAIAVLLTHLVVPALAADRTLGERIGLQVKFNHGQPPEHLAIVNELGVRWVREHVSWRSLEPTAGRLRGFPPAFRHRLVHYRERDIGVIFVLGLSNPDAYPPTADDPYRAVNAQAFGRYALEVAAPGCVQAACASSSRSGTRPHGRNFELAPLLGGDWTGKHPSPWLDHYVRLVHEVVRRVKGFDASIPVMSSDDMWVVHYWMLQAGLPREPRRLCVPPLCWRRAGANCRQPGHCLGTSVCRRQRRPFFLLCGAPSAGARAQQAR